MYVAAAAARRHPRRRQAIAIAVKLSEIKRISRRHPRRVVVVAALCVCVCVQNDDNQQTPSSSSDSHRYCIVCVVFDKYANNEPRNVIGARSFAIYADCRTGARPGGGN